MTDDTISDQQAEIRRLNAQRRRLKRGQPAEPDEQPTKPRRLSMGAIVELLLTRGGGEHSAVELTRNAKGETQINVTVRTSEDGEIETADDAARKATELYDQLRARYPMSSGLAGAAPPDASPSKRR